MKKIKLLVYTILSVVQFAFIMAGWEMLSEFLRSTTLGQYMREQSIAFGAILGLFFIVYPNFPIYPHIEYKSKKVTASVWQSVALTFLLIGFLGWLVFELKPIILILFSIPPIFILKVEINRKNK